MAEEVKKYITLDSLSAFKDQYNATISSKKLPLDQLEANASGTDAVELTSVQIKGKYYKITHRNKVSELTNDIGFITKSISNLENYFTKNEVTSMINNVSSIRFEIVSELPEAGNTATIYLLAKAKAVNNTYDEYIFVNDNWELIGTTSVDLSNYYTISQADSKFALKSAIPVVNNSTITITQNGTSRGSFTLNQSKNNIIEISDTIYTLPIASSEKLGGIKVGSNLTITNGVLSAVQGKVTIDDTLSSTSTNSIQNKIVNSALANKQNRLTDEQLSAVNSGITSNKITTYDSYASQIENKADATYATDAEIEALFANN